MDRVLGGSLLVVEHHKREQRSLALLLVSSDLPDPSALSSEEMNTIRGGFFTFFVVPSVGQTTTSSDGQDVQNAENVRSQAEKRLETQRKDLTRNWGG